MKTAKQFAEEYYNLIYNNYGSLQDLEDYFIEYGKQLLIEASERAKLQVDDYFEITESGKVSNEDCCVTISKSSILNIINELK